MKQPMCIGISRHGLSILYRCYKMPGRGKSCPDKDTNKCLKCKYAKAEMPASDATRLLDSYGRKVTNNCEILCDNTLHITVDMDISSISRILLSQNGTQFGELYYSDATTDDGGENDCLDEQDQRI